MALTAMSRDKYAAPGKWGESKKRVNVMLTPSATERIDNVAEALGITRSEVLERLCRTDFLSAAKLNEIDNEVLAS